LTSTISLDANPELSTLSLDMRFASTRTSRSKRSTRAT